MRKKPTSVTIPSLFLSNAFRNKSEDLNILMKFSLVNVPSSPAIFITLEINKSNLKSKIYKIQNWIDRYINYIYTGIQGVPPKKGD